MWALNINNEKCCLSKRTKLYSSRTHCWSPQPVACIRGYEPSGSGYSNCYPTAFITRLHFRHQNHNDAMLAAKAIKYSAIESYDVKYKWIYIWRNMRLYHWLHEKYCLSKRTKLYSSRTHRCSPQPVACIRDYEPSGSGYSNCYPIAFITRLHFRHRNHNDAMLAAKAIKHSAIQSYDIKYK